MCLVLTAVKILSTRAPCELSAALCCYANSSKVQSNLKTQLLIIETKQICVSIPVNSPESSRYLLVLIFIIFFPQEKLKIDIPDLHWLSR